MSTLDAATDGVVLLHAPPTLRNNHLPTEDEVAQASDRWRPYRSLAVSYVFASEYDGQP